MRVRVPAFLASALVLVAAVAVRASHHEPVRSDAWLHGGAEAPPYGVTGRPQRTTNDGVYSTVQADAAKPQYEKLCASCHAFTVATKKKPEDLPLGDEPFFRNWEGKALSELVSVIVLTMPNDGSAVVDEPEALNLVAYVLQQNGIPAGPNPLTRDSAGALLVRPKPKS